MGRLTYENTIKVDIDDRALAHLQIVVINKLKHGEPFSLSWKDDASIGDGRTTVWINPNSSLVFKFYGSRRPNINRAWLDALAVTANSSVGLYLVPEPSERAGRSAIGSGPALQTMGDVTDRVPISD